MPIYDRKLGTRKLILGYLFFLFSLPLTICVVSLLRNMQFYLEYGEFSKLATLIVLLIPLSIFIKLGTKFYYEGKGLMMSKGEEIIDKHPSFILYLRSFGFDLAQGIEKSWENIIVTLFKNSNPVLAIGMPEDSIPPAGANRIYIEQDSSWQDKVLELIPRARLVIVTIDNSKGLLWEVEQVTLLGDPEKITLFCPPTEDRALIYENFKTNVNGFFGQGLPSFHTIENRYFIHFNKDWSLAGIKNKGLLYYLNLFHEKFLNQRDDKVKCIAELSSVVKSINGRANWIYVLLNTPNIFIMFVQACFIILILIVAILALLFSL